MGISDLYKTVNNGASNVVKPLTTFFQPPKVQATAVPTPTQYNLKDRGVQISEADLNAFRPLLYGEVSNRTPDKQLLEANVILNTAINRVKGHSERGKNLSVSQVISDPTQYQAYGGTQYKNYSNPVDAPSIAKKQQVDAIVNSLREQIRNGTFQDNTQGAYYYSHAPDKSGKIYYDNTRPLYAKK